MNGAAFKTITAAACIFTAQWSYASDIQLKELTNAAQHWIFLTEACRFTYPELNKPTIYRKMALDIVRITGKPYANAQDLADKQFAFYEETLHALDQERLQKIRQIDDGSQGHFIYCETSAFETQQNFRSKLRSAFEK
ncbi:hypothetical protein W822_20105 [Advenella kashmirensis W13003]|uniref:Uncharacterized protein n=1 Tax=Advenella kashmirensis W13003 TaxID=1424334 RepID=V8QMQ6_9BURK|nr:hypothetical protein [Advenella kashmirensis]ETF00947.1 hypothetical protein W822_20105 [Advenella kashmirensis W13003]